ECIECDAEQCNNIAPEKRCSRCLTVYYCGVACQRSHWKAHKALCINVNVMRQKLVGIAGEEDAEHNEMESVNTDVECGICLEDQARDPVVIPQCRHVFCFACLQQWKERSDFTGPSNRSTCPYCRTELLDDREHKLKQAQLCVLRVEAAKRKKGVNPEGRIREYYDSALSDLDCLLRDNDEDLQTLFTKAEILIADGRNPENAIEIAKKIMEINEERGDNAKTMTAALDEVQNAMRTGDEDEAERLMATIDEEGLSSSTVSRIKDQFAVPLLLAEAYERAGQWTESKDAYKDMFARMSTPDTTSSPAQQRQILMGLCRSLYELGTYDGAIVAGSLALEINRHYPGAHKYVALAQKESGDLNAAIVTMNRAVLYETPWCEENKEKNREVFYELKDMGRK
ncbi:unnamed protein product, partial [Heterosigma akashiwo]